MNFIEATYLVEGIKEESLKDFSENLALHLSIGGWGEIPSSKRKEYRKFTGKVIDAVYSEKKGLIKVALPVVIFEHRVSSIFSILAGKLPFMKNVKLIDVDFPPQFLDHFQGPKFGINGIRDILGLHHEPLLMTTIYPASGLSLKDFEEEFFKHASGGSDIVKDSEIYFDDSFAPFEKRIEIALKKSEEAESITGRKTLYVPLLKGNVDEILKKAEIGVSLGIKGFLIDGFSYSFELLQYLSEKFDAFLVISQLLVPQSVSSSLLLGKLVRLAGADIVIFPSYYTGIPHTDVMEISENLRSEWESINMSFPAPTGGLIPKKIKEAFDDFGSQTVFNLDGDVYKHPDGVFAGVKAFRDGLDCILSGVSLDECRLASPELDKALKEWE